MMVVYDSMAAIVSNFYSVKKSHYFFCLLENVNWFTVCTLEAQTALSQLSQHRPNESVCCCYWIVIQSEKKIILDSAVDDAHVPNSWCFGIQLKSSSGVLAKHGLRARFLRLKASQLWRGPLSRQRMRRSRRKCGGRNSGDNVPFKKKASWSQQSDVTQ